MFFLTFSMCVHAQGGREARVFLTHLTLHRAFKLLLLLVFIYI